VGEDKDCVVPMKEGGGGAGGEITEGFGSLRVQGSGEIKETYVETLENKELIDVIEDVMAVAQINDGGVGVGGDGLTSKISNEGQQGVKQTAILKVGDAFGDEKMEGVVKEFMGRGGEEEIIEGEGEGEKIDLGNEWERNFDRILKELDEQCKGK